MRILKTKKSKRLLALFLSIVMMIYAISYSFVVYAATNEHPNCVTITVVNTEGQAIKDATVSFTVDSVTNGDEYISDSKATDEYGVVEVMPSGDFVADDLTISASVSATDYIAGSLAETAIASGEDNFEITLESSKITDVTIEAKTGLVYNGQPQELVTVTALEGDTITYELDGGAPTTEKPMATDAGEYIVKVTVSRPGKDDLVVDDIKVTIEKADLKDDDFAFVQNIDDFKQEISGSVPYDDKTYDFSASLNNSITHKGTISYSIELSEEEEGIASIDENTGKLTVKYPGEITVKATISADKNYNEATISHVLTISGVVDENEKAVYIDFATPEVEYILGISDTISKQTAEKKDSKIDGDISYTLDKVIPGVSIDDKTGEVTVSSYDDLADAISGTANGTLEFVVTATKAKKGGYSQDTASYVIKIKFDKVPETKCATDALNVMDVEGKEWYVSGTGVVVTAPEGYSIAKKVSESFDESVKFDDEGRKKDVPVYLKSATGGICKVLLNIDVDKIKPVVDVKFNGAEKAPFYNKDVKVTVKVDETNFNPDGVIVSLTKDGSVIPTQNLVWIQSEENGKNINTAEFTLAAGADYSGNGDYDIQIRCTDLAGNPLEKDYTSGKFTIDTISPVITITPDHDGKENYYDDTLEATVTIKEHNFNKDDVKITVIAKDVTGEEKDSSKLHSLSEWTNDDANDTHEITITYPGDANYTFDVEYTDLAGNSAADLAEDYFTVDTSAPTNIKVKYTTSVLDTVLESLSFGFYNAKVTVTISAEDATSGVEKFIYSYVNAKNVSSVNASLEDQTIGSKKITYSEDGRTATASFKIPKEALGRNNQFNGTVKVIAVDRAGNESDVHKESKRIVVDNISPVIQVSYNEPINVVGNTSYYKGNVEATINIKEANFYAKDVRVVVSKDGSPSVVNPKWKDESLNSHIGTFSLTEDGDYVITISYQDKSSNKMKTYTSKQLTVDTDIKAPTYTFNGVAKKGEGGAYKGDVSVGFNFKDENFDTKTIKLVRTRFDKVEDVTDEFINVKNNNKGGNGTFTIPSEVGNDGIYVLQVGMTDKATNETDSKVKFTINRFGSVYEYSDELVGLIKEGGQYVTSVDNDLIITEYNAEKLLKNSLKIMVTRDGERVDVDYTSSPKRIDSGVDIGDSGWYQYVYTIKASNFDVDGVYKISLTSEYAAVDSKKNKSTSVPENSIDESGEQILDTMNFTVDSTAPEIRNIVNLDKAIVNAQTLDVKYTIVDVGGIKSVEVIVDGKTVDNITDFGDSVFNYSGQFTLTEASGAQRVQIRVTDIAGNVTDTASENFSTGDLYVFNDKVTVSTNFFVRWYANKPLFWGIIGGVILLIAAICTVIGFKKRKRTNDN